MYHAAIFEKARLRRKVNFAAGKIPLRGKSPQKCIYSIPAQETAKHRTKFGWPPVSHVAAAMKPLEICRGVPNYETILAVSGPKFAIL